MTSQTAPRLIYLYERIVTFFKSRPCIGPGWSYARLANNKRAAGEKVTKLENCFVSFNKTTLDCTVAAFECYFLTVEPLQDG